MALGSTQPVTGMSTAGGKGGRCIELRTLRPSCPDSLEILRVSTSWSPKGLSRAVQELLLPYSSELLHLRTREAGHGGIIFDPALHSSLCY
jgi:hypothetical protein